MHIAYEFPENSVEEMFIYDDGFNFLDTRLEGFIASPYRHSKSPYYSKIGHRAECVSEVSSHQHSGVAYPERNCYPAGGSLWLCECQEVEQLWKRL